MSTPVNVACAVAGCKKEATVCCPLCAEEGIAPLSVCSQMHFEELWLNHKASVHTKTENGEKLSTVSVAPAPAVTPSTTPEASPAAPSVAVTISDGNAPVSAENPEKPTEAAKPAESGKLSQRDIILVFTALSLAMLLAALDQTIVAVALTSIADDLNDSGLISWIVSSYLLTNASIYPLIGRFSDVFGRNIVFQLSIWVFLLGSLLCGVSNSMLMLILCRGLQGFGCGGIQAMVFIIIGDAVSARERGKYMAIITLVWGAASVAGPLIGGSFVSAIGWQWIFFVNLPFGFIASVVSFRVVRKLHIPKLEGVSFKQLDYLGSLLVLGSTVALMLAITWGGVTFAWSSGTVIGLLVASFCGYTLFVLNEKYLAKLPILDMRLFKNRSFTIGSAGYFFCGASMYGLFTYLAPYFEDSPNQNYDALQSGIRTLPLILGVMLSTILTGIYTVKTGNYRRLPAAGMVINCAGVAMLSHMDVDSNYGYLAISMIIAGAGLGMALSPVMTAVQGAVDRKLMASATSGIGAIRSLGASIGLAVFGVILNQQSSGDDPAGRGTHYICLWMLIPSALSAIIYVFLPGVQLQTTSLLEQAKSEKNLNHGKEKEAEVEMVFELA